jgi:hypothetical protein
MAAEFVRRDEFADAMTMIVGEIRALRLSIVGLQSSVEERIQEVKADLQAFRERHDVELAQTHQEIGRLDEILMYVVQRLPPEPIQPPPIQFLKHEDE